MPNVNEHLLPQMIFYYIASKVFRFLFSKRKKYNKKIIPKRLRSSLISFKEIRVFADFFKFISLIAPKAFISFDIAPKAFISYSNISAKSPKISFIFSSPSESRKSVSVMPRVRLRSGGSE